jgi:8-oxo-dGTP diphosphatase
MQQKTTPKTYEKAMIAIDPVIFTISEGKLKVALEKREKNPYNDKYELMGGLLRQNQTSEELLALKLSEILGEKVFFQQFNTFTNPKRDPRTRVISIGYIALVREEIMHKANSWFSIDNLPEMAFDHEEIIKRAYTYLKENLNSEIVKHFLPKRFPLNKLQDIHEIIKKENYDNRNFRKSMLIQGIVEQTKDIEKAVSHRPAILYQFKTG